MNAIHEASWVCPATAEPIHDGAIAIGAEGRILRVGTQTEMRDLAGVRIRHANAAIVPGFVNAHTHLELTVFRGFLENLSFTEWIRTLVRVKYGHLDRAALKVSAQLGAIENLRAGVTAVGETMDTGTAWEAMQESGLQGVAYQEIFGPDPSVAENALKELRGKIDRYRPEETQARRLGVSPHAPYTVSEELYRGTADYAAAENLPVAVHIAESREETAFVRDGAGPFADALRKRGIAVHARNVGPMTYLDRAGLLRPGTLLIHAIEIDDAEVRRIHDSGAAVAHCPKSNAKLGHRIAHIVDLRASGVANVIIGLGTDSVASNNVVDMFEEMRTAIFHQRIATGRIDTIDARAAFGMATIDGARALGLDRELGSLEPGKRADFAVVDLGEVTSQPVYDPIETMVYSASRANVLATYLSGQPVSFAEEPALLKDIATIGRRLRNLIGLN